MLENYELVSSGHIYQKIKTGPSPSYSKEYSEKSYDKYEMTGKISELRFSICKSIFKFSSVLDFGYGNGSFLRECKKNNISCFGYDISDYPLPPEIIRTTSPFIDVDLITFFDSIEHLEQIDISGFISSLKTNQILISVPWLLRTCDEHFLSWKHRRENEHFHHFTVGGLSGIMESAGFIPLWHGNPEDCIRKTNSEYPNILTMAGARMLK